MSGLLTTFASATRTWTRFYTSGLPADLREDRRTEIDCDLWEHQHLARLQRVAETATAREILLRFLMGIPADCAWRVETGAMVRSEKRNLLVKTDSRVIRVLTVVAVLFVSIVVTISSIGIIINGWQDDRNVGWMMFGVIPIIASVAIITGLLTSPARAARGITLVVVGCLVLSVAWFWMFFLTIPISIGLIALSYKRAKQSGWRTSHLPA